MNLRQPWLKQPVIVGSLHAVVVEGLIFRQLPLLQEKHALVLLPHTCPPCFSIDS